MNFPALIEEGSVSVFVVPSQTTRDDRRSLLRLQQLVRVSHPGYSYLEVGSHKGGSLFPHLVDDRCGSIVAVDPRPAAQPDERGRSYAYHDNTTSRMIGILEEAAGKPPLAKLRTFDSDISGVTPRQVGRKARLALIDGEHTNRAAFRDFTHVLRMVEDDAVIAFHDSNILIDAIWNVETFLGFIGKRRRGFYLPSAVYAVALGKMVEPASKALGPHSLDAETFYKDSKQYLLKAAIKSARTQAPAKAGEPAPASTAPKPPKRPPSAVSPRQAKKKGPWHSSRRVAKRFLRVVGLASRGATRK